MDYEKERKNQMKTGFISIDGEALRVRWNLKIKYSLYGFICDKMRFRQSKMGFREVVIH